MMSVDGSEKRTWLLDSSTFIHAMIVDRVGIVAAVRAPLCFSEYVFRFELGISAKAVTRDHAEEHVRRKRIGIQSLTLSDLDRIASFGAPRRIGLGELSCIVIAERLGGGILCDDWRAKAWVDKRMSPLTWESIEAVLLDAAASDLIGELDLADAQKTLERYGYSCRYDLQIEHIQRRRKARGGQSDDYGG